MPKRDMDPRKPSLEDLQRAFAVTSLEPEIPDETLIAYAAGRATDIERDLVETMLEADPSLSHTIATIREELATVASPLPTFARVAEQPKRSSWIPRWLSIGSALVAVGSCCVLAVLTVDRSRLIQDADAKNREAAVALDASRKSLHALQEKFVAMEKQVGASETAKQQVLAELSEAHRSFERMQQENMRSTEKPGGVDSMVARVLTHGLSIPASIAAISISIPNERGPVDLDVAMIPNQTSVLPPVKLSWSGAPAADYGVEITQDGRRIWNARLSQSSTTVPSGLLKPGNVYAWQVTVGSKRSRLAGFRTCTEGETLRANRIERDKGMGPLEKGVLYAAMGLVSDARVQFKLLHAGDSALADRLTKELGQFGN